ncbi:unconventional myosin-VIIa [Exaiptasia diaphana]|uniref:Uncharacterized protein n=1 Tax=Exaiptasia diaphana TaxID=2652724 RepID=A0A913XIN9_EXADI|nr:unconventional myosin-VIIa [Exaiptasia diaphana]KXJ11793.1 Unconventional myosin-VIIa [Exaiptasia diaphana]
MSSNIEHLSPMEESDDLSKYTFIKYARDNYREGSPSSHTRGSLQKPLHLQDNEHNYEAALTIFHVIQRFMFDLPEPTDSMPDEEDNVFLRTLARNSDFGEGTFKRKIDSVKMPGWTSIPHLSSMSKPTTNMEKVRFICSYGIYCQELRDEIYSQICMQLTNNPSKTSTSRGWIILAVCLGCFPPSEKFINYLRNFLRQGPEGYAEFCENKLMRTMAIGCRKLAPASLELGAAKMEGKIMIPIITMDSKTYEFEVDSSTTCEELLKDFQSKLGLKNIFGFSVFAKQFEEVFNWGCGSDCIMDLISLCEQYAIYKHVSEEERHNWTIFVRKDVFLSSHNAASDPVETNLIYWQIMGGIHVGEYHCTDNNELAELLAKRYYVEYGKIMTDENLGNIVENGGPPNQDYQQHMELTHLVQTKFQSTASIVSLSESGMSKIDVVNLACSKKAWQKDFSRIFNANLISGPKLPKGPVRLFFHSGGVDLLSTKKKSKGAFFLNILFEHIASITNDSPEYMKIKGGRFDTSNYLTIRTYEKSTYTFSSPGAKDMYKLGHTLLEDYKRGDPTLADVYNSP